MSKSKVICSWCKSPNTERKSSGEFSKYEEYICQDCKKSSWQQIYNVNLPLFLPEKREFFMLDPDSFPFLGR